MKRLHILSLAFALLLCSSGCTRQTDQAAATNPAAAPAGVKTLASKGWQLGKHYALVETPQLVEEPGSRVEIAEVFWYGCTHCYTFEPHLVLWGKQQEKNVHIVRVPALLFEPQRAHARLFYTLQDLGRADLHQAVYDAIHRDGNPLTAATPELALEVLLPFVTQHGIDAEEFKRVFNSELVAKQTARAEQLMRTYKIEGTPSIIVGGKFRSDAFLTGSQEQLIALTQDLAEGLRE